MQYSSNNNGDAAARAATRMPAGGNLTNISERARSRSSSTTALPRTPLDGNSAAVNRARVINISQYDNRIRHVGETTIVAVRWFVWAVMLGCTLLVIYAVYKFISLRGALSAMQTRVEKILGHSRNDLMQNYATLKARGDLLPWTVDHVLRWSDAVRVDMEKGPLHVHVDVLPNHDVTTSDGLAPSQMIPPRVDRSSGSAATSALQLPKPVDEWHKVSSTLAAADMHATVHWHVGDGDNQHRDNTDATRNSITLANVDYSPHTPGVPIQLSVLPDILGGGGGGGSKDKSPTPTLHNKNASVATSSHHQHHSHRIQYDEILQYMTRAYGYCMEQSKALIETLEQLIQPPMRALEALRLSSSNPAAAPSDAAAWRVPFATLYRNTRALLAMLHTCAARVTHYSPPNSSNEEEETGESNVDDDNMQPLMAIPELPPSFLAYFENDQSKLLGLNETLVAFQIYKQDFYSQLERAVWSFAMRCKSRVTSSAKRL